MEPTGFRRLHSFGKIGIMIDTGHAIVISGPTAVGKGTVLAELRKRAPEIEYSVSATTRSPRPGEIDGVHYYFVTAERFDELIASGEMLEWALVHGLHRYGTPRGPVAQAIAAGKRIILEVDLDGARQIRKSLPEARQIFIAPPSFEELVSRLRGRGTEDPAEQARRLETARVELAAQDEFDAVVVNDDVANATAHLLHIINESA